MVYFAYFHRHDKNTNDCKLYHDDATLHSLVLPLHTCTTHVLNSCVITSQALNKWMVKAEPVQALLDPLYFYKKIIECEANVAADRKSNP